MTPAARRNEGHPCGQLPSGSTSHCSSQRASAFSSPNITASAIASNVRPCCFNISVRLIRCGFCCCIVFAPLLLFLRFMPRAACTPTCRNNCEPKVGGRQGAMGWGIAHLERSGRLASASDFRDGNYGETPCDAPGRSPQSHGGLLPVALKRAEKDCGALPAAANRGCSRL